MKDVQTLFTQYSAEEVLVFLAYLCAAVYGFVQFLDWANKRIHQKYDADTKEEKIHQQLETEFKRLSEDQKRIDESYERIDQALNDLNNRMDQLVDSGKESIRSYIVEKHHLFCYEKKWIDDYSLDCLEKKFENYKAWHGNSFIAGLMDEIRDLPKVPPEDAKDGYNTTAEYVKRSHERRS